MESKIQRLAVATWMAASAFGGSSAGVAAEGLTRADYEAERKDLTGRLEWLAEAVPETADAARDEQALRKAAAAAGISSLEVGPVDSPVEKTETADFRTEALTLQVKGRGPWASVESFLRFEKHRLARLARLEARAESGGVAFTARFQLVSQSTPLRTIPPSSETRRFDGVTEEEALSLRRDRALANARIEGISRLTVPEAPWASRSVLWKALADAPGLAVRELYLGGEATVDGIIASGALDDIRQAFDQAGFEVWDVTSTPFGACRRVTVVGAVRPHAEADGEKAPDNLFAPKVERECRTTADAQTGWVIGRAQGPPAPSAGGAPSPDREALSLHLHDVDLANVFRVLEAATGQGFVVDPDVRGRVSLDLEDTTLEDAIGALAEAGLRVSAQGPIRRVSTGNRTPPPPSVEHCRGLFEVAASFSWKGAELRQVIGLFADITGLRFFAPTDVRGPVSLFVREVASSQALCAVLESSGLDFVREGDRVYVGKKAALLARAASARGAGQRFEALESEVRHRFFDQDRRSDDYKLVGTFARRGVWSALLATAEGQATVGESGHALPSKVRVVSVTTDSAVLESGGGPVTLKLAPPHALSQSDSAGALGAQIEDGPRGSEPGAGSTAVVKHVLAQGPAGEAQLRPGDVIRSLDGAPVANAARLRADLRQRKAGEVLSLGIERRGASPIQIDVRLTPARPLFQRACDAGDGWGCERLAVLYEEGTGVEKDPLRAFALAEKGCAAGDGRACFRLWRSFDRATGAPSDPEAARAALKKSCDLGELVACGRLALACETGEGGVAKDLPRAVSEYQRLCAAGEGGSCGALGDLHAEGQGVPKDEARAVAFFRQACDLGVSYGCTRLALSLRDGKGVSQDEARAIALLGQACDEDDPVGCRRLAGSYELGRGVSKDLGRAAELYRRACDLADASACASLGTLHESGTGVARDLVRAASLYRRACEADDARGCASLGALRKAAAAGPADGKRAKALFWRACHDGDGRGCRFLGAAYEEEETTLPSAARLYGRACEAGDQGGCWRLGILYRDGKGVPEDKGRAASLFEKACAADDAHGCASLGLMHEFGRGVRRDEARAAELYRRACDLGDALGCAELGDLYGAGRGVALDQEKRLALLVQACEGDYAATCAEAGLRYANGDAVAPDRARGVQLLRRGCAAGDALSCETLRRLGADR